MVMMRGKEHRMIDPKINHLCLVNWVHMLLLILYAFVWCMKYLYSDMKMSSSEDNFIQKFYTHVGYLMTLVVWFFPTSVYKNKENSKQYPLSTLDMSQWCIYENLNILKLILKLILSLHSKAYWYFINTLTCWRLGMEVIWWRWTRAIIFILKYSFYLENSILITGKL